MKQKKSGPLYLNPLLHLLSWMLLLLLLFLLAHGDYSGPQPLGRGLPLFFFFLLFYLNFFLFIPKLLFQKKLKEYFGVVILSVVFASALLELIRRPPPPHLPEKAPSAHSARPDPWHPPDSRIETISRHFVIFVLVLSLSCAIRVTFHWDEKEVRLKELEKEHLQAELTFLKNQISPHFFFNTLNTIYLLTELNPKHAQEAILKLSTMMRYLLYESETALVPLAREIELLRNYIELMKLRLSNTVEVSVHFPEHVPEIHLAPLLFIPLVENAFKHGISFQKKSFCRISLTVHENQIHFDVANSQSLQKTNSEEGGIGLQNIQKRLDLLYPQHYTLTIHEDSEQYRIQLSLVIS